MSLLIQSKKIIMYVNDENIYDSEKLFLYVLEESKPVIYN